MRTADRGLDGAVLRGHGSLCLPPGDGDTLWAGGEVLWNLAFSETTVEQGIAALRVAAARHRAGTPIPLRD